MTNSADQAYAEDVPENVSPEVSAAAAALAAQRKTHGGGRPALKKKCPYCKLQFSARELWAHKGNCPRKPADLPKPGRPVGTRKCPNCEQFIAAGEMKQHKSGCKPKVVAKKAAKKNGKKVTASR